VGVEIDERGEEQEPIALDDLGPVGAAQLVGRCAASGPGDDAVFHDDVDHVVELLCRVDGAHADEEKEGRR
jgi:hypothetical protein